MTIPADKNKHPFTLLFDEWWREKQFQLKKGSIRNLLPYYEKLRDFFGDEYIENVDLKAIQRYINRQTNYTQAKKARTMLAVFFDYLYDREIVWSNPARKAKLPKKEKPQLSVTKKFLERDELKRILEQLHSRKATKRIHM